MIYEILMLVAFFLTGFLASSIGSIPASSSNVAMVTTTIESNFKNALNIAFGAGFGSTILAFFALWFSRVFTNYFENNSWLQILFLVVFFIIGILILFRKKIDFDFDNPLAENWNIGGFWKGALLSFLNPPALVFWIVIISAADSYLFSLSKFSPLLNLLVFFCGIYLGKFTTLYIYGKLSDKMKDKKSKDKNFVYTIVGAALVIGSLVQGIRMILE